MQTLAANGAVVAWGVLLTFAPGLLLCTFRRCTPLAVGAGAMAAMTAVSAVTCVVSRSGWSPVPPLRVLAVLLLLALVAAGFRAVRGRPGRPASSSAAHAAPSADQARNRQVRTPVGALAVTAAVALLGVWLLAPMLLVLHHDGVSFGLLTHGNADESNYVLAAQNMSATGFHDSHHLANSDLGEVSRTNYVGAITVLVWLSALTPLSTAQVALAAMALATALAAVALWALATEVWPTARPVVALPGVVLVSASGLAAYTNASYFLGAELGLAAAAAALAGAVSLASQWSWPAALGAVGAGAFGVYAYGHIGLLVLVAMPVAAGVAGLVTRGPSGVPRAVARALVADLVALVLALPTLSRSYDLLRSQSDAQAGWSLPALSPVRALLWPQGIGLPSSGSAVAVSWGVLLAALLAAIVVVGRGRAERRSAILAGLVLVGAAVVLTGAVHIYGEERYQTWKMLALVLPLGLVVALPAVALVRIRGMGVGLGVLNALAGAALLGPWLQWSDVLAAPDAAIATNADLVASVQTIEDRGITAINVRLPDLNQNMMAGAMLPDTAVVLSQATYYPAMASTATCTLTIRPMLTADDTGVVPLSGDYVLLERPSSCLTAR